MTTVEGIEGYVDVITREYADGWVWLPGEPSRRLTVKAVLADHEVGQALADQERPDLLDVGKGDGLYGFRILFAAPLASGTFPKFIASWSSNTLELPFSNEPASPLKGVIENIEYGENFLLVQGWVCKSNGESAAYPLDLSIAGQAPIRITTRPRNDLASAGVCHGNAAFAVIFDRPASIQKFVQIVDGDGCVVRWPIEELTVSKFTPRGRIESVGPEGISGWLLDPNILYGEVAASLQVDDKQSIEIEFKYIRDDVPFQIMRSAETYLGFSVSSSRLLDVVRGRRGAELAKPIEIVLRSGQQDVWRHVVPMTGGESYGDLVLARAHDQEHKRPLAALSKSNLGFKASSLEKAAYVSNAGIDEGRGKDGGQAGQRVLVVSWDMGHNPVGRAYLLADIAAEFTSVRLTGPLFERYGKQVWGPLRSQCNIEISTFVGSNFRDYLKSVWGEVTNAEPADVVYVSKPRLPSLIYGLLMKLVHGSKLVVDVDDHELSFFKSPDPLSLEAGLAEARRTPDLAEMPFDEVWTRVSEALVGLADQVTVSNVALQEKFGGTIIRHARNERQFNVSSERRRELRREFGLRDDDVVVIFVGTPRPHKGIFEIAEAIERINDPRLVFVIIGTITDKAVASKLDKYRRARIKQFGDMPFDRLHEMVSMGDVAPVLQRYDSVISDFQIPAKLTDAMALGIPVIATEVAPLADLQRRGVFVTASADNLDLCLRSLLANRNAFDATVARATAVYHAEFSYAANADQLKKVFEAAGTSAVNPALEQSVRAVYAFAGVELPKTLTVAIQSPAPLRKRPRDLVFFWKQNDTDLYGRRSDMMLKYLIETGRVGRVLHLDRPRKLTELFETVDYGSYANFHEGNLVFTNTVERMLKMRDSRRVAKRTFIHRDGSVPQSLFGRELPPSSGYMDFVRKEIKELGFEAKPMAWVCPVVFDFPQFHEHLRFDPVVVDIIDDQRRWKATEGYMQRVAQSYVDTLAIADLVLANCYPVQEGFRALRNDIRVVPNGAEIFDESQAWPMPADLAEIPGPRIGYVGNLRDRIDTALIRQMVERHPNWSIVLIGSARGAMDIIALSELPNVHLLGVRKYEQALSYIKHFDVAIMPHAHNEISENMNPLKLYVYFALGVPIVTTEVANIGDIGPTASVAQDPNSFIAAVEQALAGNYKRIEPVTRKVILDKVSWTKRVEDAMVGVL